MVCAATVVLIPAALLSYYVAALEEVSYAIGILLIINSVMLFVSDRLNRGDESLENTTVLRTFFIGLFQLFGILPGISRSGSTITGGLFNSLNRKDAVRFSFLMSIPAILGANLLVLIKAEGDFFAVLTFLGALFVFVLFLFVFLLCAIFYQLKFLYYQVANYSGSTYYQTVYRKHGKILFTCKIL